MVDMAMGFSLMKFDAIGDCVRVYSGGPWIIMNHYLTIGRWDHDFKPEEAKEVPTEVWIRISRFPIEYYEEYTLFFLG